MPSYSVERYLPHIPKQLFDLVADVERYPEFVPWWIAATIWDRHENVYDTRQTLGLQFLRHEFLSKTTLNRPEHIHIGSVDRPFKTFNMNWHFTPIPEGGTLVHLRVDFEFRTTRYALLSGLISGEGIRRLIDAFESRALQLFNNTVLTSPPRHLLTSVHHHPVRGPVENAAAAPSPLRHPPIHPLHPLSRTRSRVMSASI